MLASAEAASRMGSMSVGNGSNTTHSSLQVGCLFIRLCKKNVDKHVDLLSHCVVTKWM